MKFLNLLRFERKEIHAIYFYAILGGIIQLSLPLGIQSIISFVLGGAISTSLVVLIVVVIVGVFTGGLLKVNQMKIIEKIQQQLFVRYSFLYANNIPKLSLKEVDEYYLPELTNRFFDIVSLQKGISKLLLDVPIASIQILFGLILLSFYHPVFIWFGILLIMVVYLILRVTGNRGLETSVQESNYKYLVAGYMQELSRIVKTLKYSRDRQAHLTKTDSYVTDYLTTRTSHFGILLLQYWTLIMFKVLVTAAMLIVGAILLVNQQLNIGQFIASEIVILTVIDSVEKLIVNLDNVYDSLTAIEKITKLTEKPLEEENGATLLKANQAISIQAKNLSFGYDNTGKLFNGLTFDIKAGEIVCLQGQDSTGKSSLLKILGRLYSDFDGSLMMNNVPVSNYNLYSLRSRIGVLTNSPDIIEGTIRENICLGDKNISYDQLDKIATITGLRPYIDNLKKGYETAVHPMGQDLSTRVIKKILLSRALVHQPQLLLLEEPWLGIEIEYAQNIQNYLIEQGKHTTVIIATNDNSFADKCDKVLTLVDGGIIAKNK